MATNLLWIDSQINTKENEPVMKYLKSVGNLKVSKNVEDGLKFLFSIHFEDTLIITSGKLYNEFIEKFQANLNNVSIIPKIIIFTADKNKFLDNNKNYKNYNSFYKFVGISGSIDELKDFIFNKKLYNFEFLDSKEKLNLFFFKLYWIK